MPRFEATEPMFRAMGVDLTAIEGIEAHTVLVILDEIGVDVSKFPTEKHFASWLGLCPNHQESNRKRKSRRVRKGKNRVAIALRLAARSLQRSHSALGAYFQRPEYRAKSTAGTGRIGHGSATHQTANLCSKLNCASLPRPQGRAGALNLEDDSGRHEDLGTTEVAARPSRNHGG